MFQFLRGIVLIATLMLNCGAAFAEPDRRSANYMMPACRVAAAEGRPNGELEYLNVGLCIGLMTGINFMGPFYGLCSPQGVTPSQAARVVVRYIDERPARMHEDFKALALEALLTTWPCKK